MDAKSTSPEPLAVAPKTAFAMLEVGTTHGYELLNSGELESFKLGRARRITTASIKALIARRLAAQKIEATATAMSTDENVRVADIEPLKNWRREVIGEALLRQL